MNDNRPVRRFFGHVLMAVGGLITVLCGGCTFVFLWMLAGNGLMNIVLNGHAVLRDVSNAFAQAFILGALTLIFGSLPTVIGVALFIVGRGMAKDER